MGSKSVFAQVLLALLVVGAIAGAGALWLTGTADPVLHSVGFPTNGVCFDDYESGDTICGDEKPYCFTRPAGGDFVCQADPPIGSYPDLTRDPP